MPNLVRVLAVRDDERMELERRGRSKADTTGFPKTTECSTSRSNLVTLASLFLDLPTPKIERSTNRRSRATTDCHRQADITTK